MPVDQTYAVAIIGAGPAGLLAAHAVERMGHVPHIFAPLNKSAISKVQCLWKLPPGLDFKPYDLEVVKHGTAAGYARLLYGYETAPNSFDEVRAGHHMVWPLDEVYDWLWDRYEKEIYPGMVKMSGVQGLLSDYSVVINTAPLWKLCQDIKHNFQSVYTLVNTKQTNLEGHYVPASTYLNGRDESNDQWFRWSWCRGEETIEYSSTAKNPMPIEMFSRGTKPISTDCTCWQSLGRVGDKPRQLHRIGRFGRWARGVMNHHAFETTVALLSTEGMGRNV